MFEEHKPDVLINCAAYTAVDKAEEETVLADKINHISSEILAKNCAKHHCRFIHISTDYVFDGETNKPYSENDKCNPSSSYGKTKLLGEQAVMQNSPDSIILRTSWLYSEFGNNFMKTMIRLGNERPELKVVFDQIGTPTYAGALADGIIHILLKHQQDNEWYSGIYHFSNQGVCSWYDFATWIMAEKKLDCKVFPIESHEFPTPVKRPHYSVLNKSKFENTFNFSIPHWTESAKRCIDKL